MKFTLAWLKEHLDTEASLDQIVDTLTNIGLEVEQVVDRASDLAAFTVAHVVEAKQHPNADKLSLCIVDTGSETVQVVCGAPNARTGMKGVFAPVGTDIPGTGLHLKPTKIRGEDSNGMLCSEREMGISDEHEGIIELPEDAPIGAPFARIAGLDDPMIEIAITPNRQDCLGVHGVARDLAAAGIGTLKPLNTEPVPGGFASPVTVEFDFPSGKEDACPLFIGRYVRGVKNGPSPRWLQDRLRAIGLRPISTLVDITNWTTFDLGRPLHVFDADKIKDGKLVLRLGRDGDKFDALDDKAYEADEEMCVIGDSTGMLALGGVIGGESSGCSEDTVNVFIEAALFDPVRTARTGRTLGIESDARYRFERGLDPAFVEPGTEIATRLVMDLCGGEPSELTITGAVPDWRRTVELRPERVRTLGGLDLAAVDSQRILEGLGFSVEDTGEVLEVAVPPWRSDVNGEADLVEEITRIHGYDRIPSVPMVNPHTVTRPALTVPQRRAVAAKRVLAARGLDETVNFSFVPRADAKRFGGGDDAMMLANPISADLDCMRPSPLPSLIAAAGRNIDRGFADLGLFEVAQAYFDDTPDGQSRRAAGIRRGMSGPRNWTEPPRPVDAFDAKADALAVLAECGAPVASLQVAPEAPPWFHPGRSGVLRLGPKNVLAAFGELHPGVLAAMDVKGPLVGFEVFLDTIPLPKAKTNKSRGAPQMSDLPAVDRDFAFLVDEGVEADRIVRAARGADKALISAVEVFDIYQGQGVEDGKKSVAIWVRLEPHQKTLTDAEIEAAGSKVVAAVAKATGASLRGG